MRINPESARDVLSAASTSPLGNALEVLALFSALIIPLV